MENGNIEFENIDSLGFDQDALLFTEAQIQDDRAFLEAWSY